MNDMTTTGPVERTWEVDGLTLAGVVYGPTDGVPMLALHGWLDNAASFETLAPMLQNVRLVALDMPGHGLSSHRSLDGSYQVWDDLPQLFGLLDKLGWDSCYLLGHSRGAIISTLMAASMPERFRALVTLDGLLPFPGKDEAVPKQLGNFLKDRKKLLQKPSRIFSSKAEYVERRSRSGEPLQVAEMLADRALEQVVGGYKWRGDHRLSGASAAKLNEAQGEAVLKALTLPVLSIWATGNSRYESAFEKVRDIAKQCIEDLTAVEIEGHHHWHMDRVSAEPIAKAINRFLADQSGSA